MALQSHKTEPVGNESLEEWESVGTGGFGHVYKARHKDWGFDVAIKILHDGVHSVMPKEKALYEEANHMEKASCESVLRVYGFYQGCPPGQHMQHGIVMEFMGGGSVQSMLTDLSGPPPHSLAFRLAHQVALGMNFLHSRELMHHDLKPSNVLLNDDLNAKIADFGLSRVYTSGNGETTTKNGGSYKYKPPEAFEDSYDPHCAFDIYSYGILLWSILTGEEPYEMAESSLVELTIPKGQRPDYKVIDVMKADGLKEMVDLMRKCWDGAPSKRPPFKGLGHQPCVCLSRPSTPPPPYADFFALNTSPVIMPARECLKVTEKVFSKHKKEIHHAVDEVLRTLEESQASNQRSETSAASSWPLQTQEQSKPYDTVDHARFTETRMSSVQDSASISTKRMSDKEKAKFVDDNMAVLIQNVSEVMAIAETLGGMVHRETYELIAVTPTSQDKMRLLYRRTFPPGGVRVKAAFYNALREHHAELVERLGG